MPVGSTLLALFLQSYLEFFRTIPAVVRSGAWVLAILLAFVLLLQLYVEIIRRQYIASLQWVFLRVRVPEDNPRNPRSMEELLNALHGIQKPPDLYERYLDGFVQSWISLEILGTKNEVSFVLRVPAGNRDMAEALIYSQYPDADIDEVADYTSSYTLDRLEGEFDLWGSEMILVKKDAYPIKTYVDFEDQFAEDSAFVDPMAAFTEVYSALKPGEEMWIQILIRPVFREDWVKEGWALAKKLGGREEPKAPSLPEKIFQLLGKLAYIIVTLSPPPESETKEKGLDVGALRLTPGETDVVKAIQRNISKVAYESKIRVAYVAPVAVFSRRARIPILFGIFRQFSDANLNSFRPDSSISTSRPTYGFVRMRQRYRKQRLLRKYRQRFFREKGCVLNVEEIATLFHFPVSYVKTPILERARAKRGAAPTNVPLAPEDLPLA